jgi:hypothetical protein
MLEARVKELQNQAPMYFRYSETLLARRAPFLMKKVTEKVAAKKEAAEKVVEKEATENPMARVIFIMS